jgi:hypothetical protein
MSAINSIGKIRGSVNDAKNFINTITNELSLKSVG